MSRGRLDDARWERVVSFSDTFTCYSAAMATWAAATDDDWPAVVDPGLWLTITEPADGVYGFGYFPPSLRAELGLVRTGTGEQAAAVDGVLAEVGRTGRAVVAGDGFHLPWHVAFQRRHVPHWFVLGEAPEGLEVFDAFAARNELGVQAVTRHPVAVPELPDLLLALPEDDPVYRLREQLAFGDDASPLPWHRYQWFVQGMVDAVARPAGLDGPDALRRLAGHFRSAAQDRHAYRQADDIWSIGRHRAFLCRRLQEDVAKPDDAAAWLEEHGLPLAKRWSHVAPLLMQATLALESGRPASTSVAAVLDELAEREEAAGRSAPRGVATPGDARPTR